VATNWSFAQLGVALWAANMIDGRRLGCPLAPSRHTRPQCRAKRCRRASLA